MRSGERQGFLREKMGFQVMDKVSSLNKFSADTGILIDGNIWEIKNKEQGKGNQEENYMFQD